jgi:nucleotide-binding universal stress UspA family protein
MTSRIVVGVDASEGSHRALQWALAEGRLRGVPVHAVFAWQFHPVWSDPGLGSMFASSYRGDPGALPGLPDDLSADAGVQGPGSHGAGDTPGGRIEAEAAVDSLLESAIARAVRDISTSGEALPQITSESVEGHPAQVLLDAADQADLLVVGARGHGGFAAALLGSISQHVVTLARCPVVVVPAS